MPFAEAHEVAGEAVRYCEERGIDLPELTADQLAAISPLLTADALAVLSAHGSIESRDGRGGTATVQVEGQLREMFDEIDKISEWCLESRAATTRWPKAKRNRSWSGEPAGRRFSPPEAHRAGLSTGRLTRSNEPFGSHTPERVHCQGAVVAPCRRKESPWNVHGW